MKHIKEFNSRKSHMLSEEPYIWPQARIKNSHHGSVIMPGVTIGNGAVIGSLSVVTKDVAPYEVVAGAPARRLRFRFNKRIVAILENIAWWDWPHHRIKERFEDFKDLRTFIRKYGK